MSLLIYYCIKGTYCGSAATDVFIYYVIIG